jgi:hypothetical protein
MRRRIMEDVQIIQGERQSGRTTTLMRHIHEFILATGARPSDVIVVVPAHNWIHWWTRMWQDTYPGVPVPMLISIRDGIRARGRQIGMLAIEDVDTLEDGLYDERLEMFVFALRGANPQIMATSARLPVNWKNYTTITTMDNKMRDKLRAIRQRRQMSERLGIAAMLAKMIVDTDDKDLIDAVLSGQVTPAEAVELAYDPDGKPRGKNH